MVLYVTAAGTPGFYNCDEGVYAAVAQDMAAGGSPIVPHFNGVPYFEKPPLVYWLTAASLRLFGEASWSARLPIAIFGALGVAALFALVDLWDDRRAAAYASICLATSFGYFLYARTLMMEIPLIALFIAAMLTFFAAYRNPRRMRPLLAATAALLGLAVMVKGLLGIALPGLALMIAAMLSREIRGFLARMPWLLMTAVLAAVAAPWHLVVELRHPGAMNHYLVEGQLLRYLSGADQLDVAPLGVPAYLAAAALWFFPWVLFLPQAAAAAVRELRARRTGPDRDLVAGALGWSLAALGFFLISPARIEYYSLPALIGMAILTGRWWSRAEAAARTARWSFGAMLSMGAAAWVIVLIMIDVSGVHLPYVDTAFALLNEHYRNDLGRAGASANLPSAAQMLPLTIVLAAAMSAAGTLGVLAMGRRARTAAFTAVCAAAFAWMFLVHRGLDLLEPFYSVGPLARRAALLASDNDRIAVMGTYENASPVSFYLRRRVLVVDGFGGDLRYGRSIDGSANPYFIDDAALERMWVDGKRVFLLVQSDGEDPPVPMPAYLLAHDPAGSLFSNRPDGTGSAAAVTTPGGSRSSRDGTPP